MKKILIFLLMLTLLLSTALLVACGPAGKDKDKDKDEEELEAAFSEINLAPPVENNIYLKLTEGINDGSIVADDMGFFEYMGVKYLRAQAADELHRNAKFKDGSAILEDQWYFFTAEPIEWRILEEKSGKALILSEEILDARAFNTNLTTLYGHNLQSNELPIAHRDKGSNYFASVWKVSQMRNFLNGEFLNVAFSAGEKQAIVNSIVKNGKDTIKKFEFGEFQIPDSVSKNLSTEDTKWIHPDFYDNPDTEDKVFLLSYADAVSDKYFTASEAESQAREAEFSDYSRALGLQSSNWQSADWMLRSPYLFYGGIGTHSLSSVRDDGKVKYTVLNSTMGEVGYTYAEDGMNDLTQTGVRPAMWVDLNNDDMQRSGDKVFFGTYPQTRLSATKTTIDQDELWKLYFSAQSNGSGIKLLQRTDVSVPKKLILPKTVNNLPVIAIETNLFNSEYGLRASVFNHVYEIVVGSNFPNLKEVKILPGGSSDIGLKAFAGCETLEKVTISEGVTKIGNNAFGGCSALTSITIPNSVTKIGNDAFAGCKKLKNITIPNSVTEIGDAAFYGCSSLTSITIPNSVTEIGHGAFAECSALTNITIPNSVTEIGDSAFSGCGALTSITIPNSVTEIGEWMFYGCSSLTSITIPNSVTKIGDGAFSDCNKLASITIPNSVTKIGDGAFSDCNKLASITIPNSVTEIGYSAFSGCGALTSITIPNSVTEIRGSAFSGCSALTSITIPNSVTKIGGGAFSDCGKLASIVIPNSVTEIGYEAFYGTAIWNNSQNNSVVYADKWAVGVKGKVTDVVIKEGTVGIAYQIFTGKAENGIFVESTLTSITIPNSVRRIDRGAFYNCDSLTSVNIDSDSGIIDIGENAFYGCEALTSITIPNSVTKIGGGAFSDCSKLASIVIPNSVTEIGYAAFVYCYALTSITIPNSVTKIERDAFFGCSALTTVTIPNSVTKIENRAFYNCRALTTVYIQKPSSSGIIVYGDNSFYSCTSLVNVYVPDEASVAAYKNASGWSRHADFIKVKP